LRQPGLCLWPIEDVTDARGGSVGNELDFEALVPEEAISDGSIELQGAIELSERSLDQALLQSVDAFVITYSGGKDSTTTTILTLEWWKKRSSPVDIHILYSDTGMEIPTLHQQALRFLEFISQSYPEVKVHIVSPEPEESFWYHIIGKGYPGQQKCTLAHPGPSPG